MTHSLATTTRHTGRTRSYATDGPALVAIGSVWLSRRNGRTIEVVSGASARGSEPYFAARSLDTGQTRRISWTTLHRDYQPR